jgi:hypothetical protein
MLACGGLLALDWSVKADVLALFCLLVFGLNAALTLYLLARSSELVLDVECMSYTASAAQRAVHRGYSSR